MSFDKYIMPILASAAIGFVGGLYLSEYHHKPVSAYHSDVTGDGVSDIVVNMNNADRLILKGISMPNQEPNVVYFSIDSIEKDLINLNLESVTSSITKLRELENKLNQ
jgi:hypothetical protein